MTVLGYPVAALEAAARELGVFALALACGCFAWLAIRAGGPS